MKLDVFITGELIDLCIPTLEYVKQSEWYSWFNNPNLNKFLEQGLFPNTLEDEIQFFNNERNKRLILIVTTKEGDDLGVISLSFINYSKRICDVALVFSEKEKHPLAALESMALITQHGFQMLGMQKICAGQHFKLKPWQKMMELIGYKVEGISEKGFIKGMERVNAIKLAINIEDYYQITAQRNGKLWDSSKSMWERYKKMPRKQFIDLLNEFYSSVRKDYYDNVFSL